MLPAGAPARLVCGLLGALVIVAGCSTGFTRVGGVTSGASVTSPAQPVVLVAAGDIACPPGGEPAQRACGQQATAELTAGLGPAAVLPLGDDQYDDGSDREFASYDASWGRFLDVTHPVVGNHEYQTRDAAGYFGYFGDRAGKPGQGWYATDVGAWRVIVLNSECAEVHGCGDDSDQGRWLAGELAAGTPRCTLAAWHRPRFSSGDEHGDYPAVAPLWAQLHKAGVDVVLNGHDHDYERFAPQDAAGHPDPGGPVEFVVGTGGFSLRGFGPAKPNSVVRWSDSFGVLAMTLRPDGYDWRFVDAPGVDSGSASCR